MHRRRFLAAVGTGLSGASAGCILNPTDGPSTSTEEDRRPLRLERIRMRLETPWGAGFHPETGELYITERQGRIQQVTGPDAGLVRDLTGETAARGEGGLLGFTFDPVDPNWAYAFQTYEGVDGLQNRILRLDVNQEFAVETMLFDGIPGSDVRNGGRIVFGPDGALWVTTGDAERPDLAQDTDSLAGKVLRLTREGEPHPDNPFDGPVYTYGHRNPQGITFVDGEEYVVDCGGNESGDEFNRLSRGENYGWPEVMGESDDDPFVQPLVSWTPPVAPGGLAYYTGPISRWRGSFFVSTLQGGHLRQINFEGDTVTQNELFEDLGRIRTTFVGPDDHLYFTTSNQEGPGEPAPTNDEIYRIRPP